MTLVFDEKLGKWVNPNGPGDNTPTASTPPPPKSLTPRPVSALAANDSPAGSGPPSATSSLGLPPAPPPSAAQSASVGVPPLPLGRSASQPPMAVAATSSGPPTPGPGAGLRPPTRPASSLNNVSDIDDLLGPAAPRSRAGGAKAKKKGRYVDVMAK